jgi:hypothetical protein
MPDDNVEFHDSKLRKFESLRSKLGLSDDEMTVENVQQLMRARFSGTPALFWDGDPFPSTDPIAVMDLDAGDPVEVVDFPGN